MGGKVRVCWGVCQVHHVHSADLRQLTEFSWFNIVDVKTKRISSTSKQGVALIQSNYSDANQLGYERWVQLYSARWRNWRQTTKVVKN